MDYYNEIDPQAAQWIRNLIAAGHIPPGDVDTRSIEDVTPAELAGYRHCQKCGIVKPYAEFYVNPHSRRIDRA